MLHAVPCTRLQVATGMDCLHERKLFHGDLKTANLLMADDFRSVVSDTHTHTHTHIHTHTDIHTHTHTHTQTHTRTDALYIGAQRQPQQFVCTCVESCLCVYVRVCMYAGHHGLWPGRHAGPGRVLRRAHSAHQPARGASRSQSTKGQSCGCVCVWHCDAGAADWQTLLPAHE